MILYKKQFIDLSTTANCTILRDDETCMLHSLTCVYAETIPVYEKIVAEYHEILKKANRAYPKCQMW